MLVSILMLSLEVLLLFEVKVSLVATSTPEAQAQNFYEKIKDYEWDLVPMMDIETNFDGLSDYVERFISTFKQLSPLTLGVYSYTSFIDYLTDAESTIKDMPFWEANYNNDPWNLLPP